MDQNINESAKMQLEDRFLYITNWIAMRINKNAADKGFWQDGGKRNKGEMIALMHSELSEALEAVRNPGKVMDDHCPEFSSLEIEMADTVIRIMDFCVGFNLRLPEAILAKMKFNESRPYMHGKTC